MPRPRDYRSRLALAAAFVLAGGCVRIDDHGPSWPAAPAGATEVLRAKAGADSASADGSEGHPFGTVQAALDAAPEGAAVLVALGTYAEPIEVERSVTLRGVPGVEIGVSPFDVTVRVDGAGTTALFEDVAFTGGTAAVALVRHGKATFVRCSFEGEASPLSAGYGVLASDGAVLELRESTVEGNEATGVVALGAGLRIEGGTIAQNALGGVLVESAPSPAVLDGVTVLENDRFGVAVLSSEAAIVRSTIAETRSLGDGVLAGKADGGGPSTVHVGGADACAAAGLGAEIDCGNEIRDHMRFGVFLDGSSGGSIRGNAIDGNAGGGIWAQASAIDPALAIEGNVLEDNGMVGIAVTGGGLASVVGNTVDATLAVQVGGQLDFGDGIAVLDGAEATIDQNTVRGSQRAGIFLSFAGPATFVGQNFLESNQVAPVLVQGAPPVFRAPAGSEATDGGERDPESGAAPASEGGDAEGYTRDEEAGSYGKTRSSDTGGAGKGAKEIAEGDEEDEEDGDP